MVARKLNLRILGRQSCLSIVAFFLSFWAAAQTTWPTPPNSQDPGTTMSWKTYCVGRVMMNMPLDRKLTWSQQFDNAEVERLQPMTTQAFWDGVEVVRQRYLRQQHKKFSSRLAHFENIGDNAAAIIYYDNNVSLAGAMLWRFVYLDANHAYQMQSILDTGRKDEPTPALFQPYLQRFTPGLSHIHPLEPGQAPGRDGLCVDGAVVSGDTGRNARAGLIAELAYGTELVVAYNENNNEVAMYSGYEDLKYDEDRAVAMLDYNAPEGFKEFKVLRKRDRVLAGMAGQEFVTRTTLNEGHTIYRMQWTIKGALDGGVLKPTIVVHLDTPATAVDGYGKPYAKLPPETELIKLWDYALSTFQWRVGALPDGQHIQVVN